MKVDVLALKRVSKVLNVETLAQATRTSQQILCQAVPLTYFSSSTQNRSVSSMKTFQAKFLTLHKLSQLCNKLLPFTPLHQEDKSIRYIIPIICQRCNKFRTNVTITVDHNETVTRFQNKYFFQILAIKLSNTFIRNVAYYTFYTLI